VWSAARRSHGRRVAPSLDSSTLIDGGSGFGPDTSIDQTEDSSAVTGQVVFYDMI
jgi:hypothetical protein